MAATKTKAKVHVKTTTTKKVVTKDGRAPGQAILTPYLSTRNPETAIAFYVRAFGFKKGDVFTHEGKVKHAELTFGDVKIFLGPENPPECRSALTLGASPITLYFYVKDVDAVTKQAKSVGAKIAEAPKDQFWGDRTAVIVDPEGYNWMVATHTGKFSQPDFGGCGCSEK